MSKRRVALVVLLLLLSGVGAWYLVGSPGATPGVLTDEQLTSVETSSGSQPGRADLQFRDVADGRQRVKEPPKVVRVEDTSHVRLVDDGVRGRILDEEGQPLAGVRVHVQRVQIERGDHLDEERDADGRLHRGASYGLGHDGETWYARFTPNAYTETDDDGWFESRIPHVASVPDRGTISVFALVRGRRPFLVTWADGTSPGRPASLPVLHDGSTVAVHWAGESVDGVGLKFGDVTDGSQLHSERSFRVEDGRVSTEWLVRGRTYVVMGDWSRGRIYGAVEWQGQGEIDLSKLLRKW